MISQREVTAQTLMSTDYVAVLKEAKVAEVLNDIRTSKREPYTISYVYIVTNENVLAGVSDLRDIVLAPDDTSVGDLSVSPVVSAQEDDVQEDLAAMFVKYHFRIVPVVDARDHILGVVHHKDIIKGLAARSFI